MTSAASWVVAEAKRRDSPQANTYFMSPLRPTPQEVRWQAPLHCPTAQVQMTSQTSKTYYWLNQTKEGILMEFLKSWNEEVEETVPEIHSHRRAGPGHLKCQSTEVLY